ncbi:MAG: hypothetical protein Q8K43_01120 [Sulfurimicrobium sp.]|jgi:uncharacterized membrane protein|nr:hypothetical protein [Sulfurimicrobium sp.]MDP1705455.1 hypothetical protein [Sulfurimicrobium sp.]MDP1896465.1 hypothetical protein [Sulfurimicrobium sp.]MDP2197820.1 hypothetical protein [Sulfurimicrobium sp.]MDP2963794.1 hypothetical protein [Sulfurimicrobium sp.]
MDIEHQPETPSAATESMVTLTFLIYGLHALSAVGGLLSPAFVVTAFLTGWPSIIAVIINYVKRGDVRGSYLETHFRWQIRTFWFALLWVLVAILLAMTFFGIPIAFVIAWIAGLWVLYRIGRGLLRLLDRRPMPV